MNPISLMNNDMSTFMMSSQKVFEAWNDTVAESFKNHCINQIQRDWNNYLQEMNVRMNIFMRAEQTIDVEMQKFEKEFKNQ